LGGQPLARRLLVVEVVALGEVRIQVGSTLTTDPDPKVIVVRVDRTGAVVLDLWIDRQAVLTIAAVRSLLSVGVDREPYRIVAAVLTVVELGAVLMDREWLIASRSLHQVRRCECR
jgi:hypothetical protein